MEEHDPLLRRVSLLPTPRTKTTAARIVAAVCVSAAFVLILQQPFTGENQKSASSLTSSDRPPQAVDFSVSTAEYADQMRPGSGYHFVRQERFVEPMRGAYLYEYIYFIYCSTFLVVVSPTNSLPPLTLSFISPQKPPSRYSLRAKTPR